MSALSFRRRVLLGSLPLLALAASMASLPLIAQATSDDDLLQQHISEYLDEREFCCIPGQADDPLSYSPTSGLAGGGLCQPNYADISVCKASGGVIFTELDGAQCARSCGLKAGLFYCSKTSNSCSQTPPSSGVAVGYATNGDCETACKPKGPVEVKTVACRCTDEGPESVTCDIVVAPPGPVQVDRMLQMPLSTPSLNPIQGGGNSSMELLNPIIAPSSSQGGAFVPRESPFASLLHVATADAQSPTSGTTGTTSPSTSGAQSDDVTVRFWLQSGSPSETQWPTSVTYWENIDDPVEEDLDFDCELGQCDVKVPRQAGTVSVEFTRSILSQSMTEMAARVLPGEFDNLPSDSSVYATQTGAIPTANQCEDKKSGTIACYDDYGEEVSSGQGGHAEITYTLRVPNVIEPVTIQDDINGQYNDKHDCLDVGDGSDPKLTLEENVTIRVVGGEFYTPQQCSPGASEQSTCCSLDLAPDNDGTYRAQLTCTIVPPLRSTSNSNDYEISVSGIQVYDDPECVDMPVDNIAWTWPDKDPEAYEGSNVTTLDVPSCVVSDCDLCWYQYDADGNPITQDACEQNTKCQWVNYGAQPTGGSMSTATGLCRPKVDVCPGFYGCCYAPLETQLGSEGPRINLTGRRFAWGYRTDEQTVEGMTIDRNGDTGVGGQESLSNAIWQCFPQYSNSSMSGPNNRGPVKEQEQEERPENAVIRSMINECFPNRSGTQYSDSSSSASDEAASHSYSSGPVERDDLWCPSGDLADLQAELIADAGNASLEDINDDSVDPQGNWLPNYTTRRHNMQDGGLVYFRYPRFNPFGNAVDFYKRDAGSDPQYDDDPPLNGLTQDGYAACMEGKRIGICLAGDPAKGTMNCAVTDANECVDGGGTVFGNGPGNMQYCYFAAILLNDAGSWDAAEQAPAPDPAAVNAAAGGNAGAGNTIGQDIVDFFNNIPNLINQWLS